MSALQGNVALAVAALIERTLWFTSSRVQRARGQLRRPKIVEILVQRFPRSAHIYLKSDGRIGWEYREPLPLRAGELAIRAQKRAQLGTEPMAAHEHSDEWLMSELAAGRRECLEPLVRRHVGPLLTFLRRMTGDALRQAAEVLVTN